MSLSTKPDQAQVTRDKLVRLAREGFLRSGFDGLAMEGLVEQAGVTRGALYHHFRDKRHLFEAVVTSIEEDLCRAIEQRVASAASAWERLVRTCEAILDRLAGGDVHRVLLIDGKAVLGSDAWWRIHRAHVFGLLVASVADAIDEGFVAEQPPEALARLLWGVLSEAAEMRIHSTDAVSSTEGSECVMWLLHSLAD